MSSKSANKRNTATPSLPQLASSSSSSSTDAATTAQAHVAQTQFFRERIIELSLSVAHQHVQLETLEKQCLTLHESQNDAIEELQASLALCDAKHASSSASLAQLQATLQSERVQGEEAFQRAISAHHTQFAHSMLQAQAQYHQLLDQQARIDSYAALADNLAAKIAEFERRVEEQSVLHRAKTDAIWTKWLQTRAQAESEQARRYRTSQSTYKKGMMKLMNISYEPLQSEIGALELEAQREAIILQELLDDRAAAVAQLTLYRDAHRHHAQHTESKMQDLYALKVTISQAKREEQRLLSAQYQAQTVHEAELERAQARQLNEWRRLNEWLRRYTEFIAAQQENISRLQHHVQSAQQARASHGLERLIIQSIADGKRAISQSDMSIPSSTAASSAIESDTALNTISSSKESLDSSSSAVSPVPLRHPSVAEMSSSERMSIFVDILNRLRRAEDELKQTKASAQTALSARSVSLTLPISQKTDVAALIPSPAPVLEDASLSWPIEDSDIGGTFFLTQMSDDDSTNVEMSSNAAPPLTTTALSNLDSLSASIPLSAAS